MNANAVLPEVVITGCGWTTPLGNNVDEVWSSLLAGQSGIRAIEQDSPLAGHNVHMLALCDEPKLYQTHKTNWPIEKKLERNMGKVSKMLCHGAFCALEQAQLTGAEALADYDSGVVIGTSASLCDEYLDTPLDKRNPKWFLHSYPNQHLAYLSILTGATGYGTTIVNACTSASQAIGQAFNMIRFGQAQVILAGGTDSRVSPSCLSGFGRLNMHTASQDVDGAMRPFDRDRSGFVLGEGAGMFVLENAEHAAKRGAKVLAKVVGYGCSMDAFRLTDPCQQGKAKAMSAALKSAGLKAGDIGYINAHGTSTRFNDSTESGAISQVFGDNKPWINSSKTMFGHSLAASGAIESIVCVQSLQAQTLHPNLNVNTRDDDCQLTLVGDQPQPVDMQYCMNNSSGIGGTNTSLIFQRV